MFRTALRNVLAHKARLLMTVLAVMLGVSFVSGTLVFTNTISEAFKSSSAKGFDHVDVAIRPDGGDSDDLGKEPALTQATLDKAAQVPGAASALGSVNGFAALAGKDGKLIGSGFADTLGANYYAGKDGKDPRYPIEEGRAPASENEIALDAKTAERTGYKVGDTVRMSVDGPVLQPKISGIFSTDDGAVSAGASLVLFDTKTAQGLYGTLGEFSEIDVKAAAGTSQAALKAEIGKVLPKDGLEIETGGQLADEQAKDIAEGTSAMRTGMLAFAGISLFVGIFIIANTFTMLVAQRTKELALMRAVGASRRQVTRSVLIEAFVVGTVAGVTGLAAGIGIGAGLRSLLGSLDMQVPDGPLLIGTNTVVASLVVGIVVTMLAAWLPGRRAAKIPPVAAMSSVHATATTKSLVLRNTIGSLFAGAGVAGVVAGSGQGLDGKALVGGGAGLLVIGVFILTPLLSRPLIAAASPLMRLFGVSGKLARQNSVRNPRRTAATASALMIGLTLITGMTVIAGSVQKAIDKMATDSLKADYVVSMANFTPLNPEVEKTLGELDEVTASTPLRNSQSKVDGSTQYLTGVDAKSVDQLVKLDFDKGSLKDIGGTSVVVDKKRAESEGWKLGSQLPVTYADGEKGSLKIGGIYEGNEMIQGILLDKDTLAPHQKQISDMQVFVKTKDGASDAAKDRIEKALGSNPAIAVDSKKDVSEDIAAMFTLMLNMLYGLLAMAVIVAVLGVINTLAMSVFERSQEIGMLRAIGLDRKGIKRMVRLESLVISLFGGVLGIGLGVFFGWAVGEMIASSMSTYSLVLPWTRMGIFLGLAAVVGILAALWPARRAAKMNMLSAIKAE
ncbi:ABC transporter permease [Streptomyces sp. NPDC050418]|uniref:ABC transporter permease n=1 Tax=Streptomyces sp. NPDC050418 TaxID=3365612 RepID=UPI00378A95C9